MTGRDILLIIRRVLSSSGFMRQRMRPGAEAIGRPERNNQRESASMRTKNLSRRKFLGQTALATGALIAAPYVRGAYAAGKLSVGFWDHWVPGANDTLTKLCNDWAAKEKVEITIDYITSQGDKDILTAAAEQQARSGHDILQMRVSHDLDKPAHLDPVDDRRPTLIAHHTKLT